MSEGKGRPKRNGAAGERPSAEATADRPGLESRLVAARILAAVVDRQVSADGLLDPASGQHAFRALAARDQALVRAIVQSALRFRGTIERRLEAALDRPLPPNAASLRHILHVGAAQILLLSVPDSAAVDLAVASAAADPRSARFTGLANALLRRIARERDAAGEPVGEPRLASAAENMPSWLRERLFSRYGPERTERIALAHLRPAPLDLTVRGDGAAWAERLGAVRLETGTLRLPAGEGAVSSLPGYSEGAWWVQDAAAALPVLLFGAVQDKRVADLCAAPGGKTAQLASRGARVTAFDISASRMRRLEGNLERLGLSAATRVGDFRKSFDESEPFDAVLLDAPCSSTGTIRRHPDVAWTKSERSVRELAAVQGELLASAARMVRPGGTLVFSNCSLDPEEGEEVVAGFLAASPLFERDPVRSAELPGLADAVTALGEVRTTPDMLALADPALCGLDGFFAARLRRAR